MKPWCLLSLGKRLLRRVGTACHAKKVKRPFSASTDGAVALAESHSDVKWFGLLHQAGA